MHDFKKGLLVIMEDHPSDSKLLGESTGVVCGSIGGIGVQAAMAMRGNVAVKVATGATEPGDMPHWQKVDRFMKWTTQECSTLNVALATSAVFHQVRFVKICMWWMISS